MARERRGCFPECTKPGEDRPREDTQPPRWSGPCAPPLNAAPAPGSSSCHQAEPQQQSPVPCCLKTHRFGGHFTLSLKNSVRMVARTGPDGYDDMLELHSSPFQRTLIAEINALYRPALVVLDSIEAFVDGGPETGKLARPGVVLAGVVRVAIDAVGVALLRIHGTKGPVSEGPELQKFYPSYPIDTHPHPVHTKEGSSPRASYHVVRPRVHDRKRSLKRFGREASCHPSAQAPSCWSLPSA